MQMVKVAVAEDFDHRSRKTFRLLGRYVGVFKEADGSFRAMEMSCKHQNADLSGGRVDGDVITCPWHGWQYNLRTGECVWGSNTRLRAHAVEVRDGAVYVSLTPID